MTTIIGDMTENELLAALAAPYVANHRQPGDVDKNMLAQATGLKPQQAAKVLSDKALAGELVEVEIFENSRWQKVYRRG